MDAYDIFKKLTKGLKFKHKVLGVKNNIQDSKLLKKEVDIKQENDSLENSDNKEDTHEENDFSQSQSDSEGGNKMEDELQLIEGIKVNKKKKKKNKQKPEDLKKKLELEEQNRFRNEHGIKAVGRNIPNALKDFSELVVRYNVPQALVDTVKDCGYDEPTPVQRQVLPCMLEGRQILACAPTGSGKTAAFLLPLLHTLGAAQGGPRALILCPTRELAHQIYREALRLSVSTQLRCTVVRNVKESKVKERESTIRKSDIVISTPNRLCYLLNRDNVNISLDKVQWLVIDEADKLFEGSAEEAAAFRQQLDVLQRACAGARAALLSATHTPAVARWSRRHLRGLINVTVGHRNAATHLVDQELLYCGNEAGKLVALRQLVQKGLKPPVLIFVQSKERAKQLFKELIYDGINVDVIHADRTQAQRERAVRSLRVRRVWVLVCTELLARGLDVRGVALVLNYDFPPSAIAYVHRVGRAGRAGQRGRAITFFTQDDVVNLRSIASVMKQSGCEVPEYMLRLKQDANKRKKRMVKAPHRDKISTVLENRPDKRKLENGDTLKENDKDTEIVKNAKNSKLRKVKNGDVGKEKKKPGKIVHKNDSKKRKKKAVTKPNA